jgi:capsular polysaccharide export protein
MLSGASALVCHPNSERRLVAGILELPVYLIEPGSSALRRDAADVGQLLSAALPASFQSPFDDQALSLPEAARLCAFWRQLIDANRGIVAGLGFAFWKQAGVGALLWSGGRELPFLRSASSVGPGSVAVWRAKAPPSAIAELERTGQPLIEVEDGFLRSQGLGADCVPPLSITVDPLGAYFDPAQASQLERILQEHEVDGATLKRARQLRERIVAAGLGKYERGSGPPLSRPGGARRHILVPGQVEDDRAVLSGGAGLTSNLDLLRRVRAAEPDAFLIYKPHPDVEAGHRKGAIPAQLTHECADLVVADQSISALLEMVDAVHVNTSLTGFEALLRGKAVTTHGVPFYAGWGLTRDLGPVPERRTRRRSLDELVAATLLLYPRYLDPVTGLPCPAEIVVDRLTSSTAPVTSLLVTVRRLQGRIRRQIGKLVA